MSEPIVPDTKDWTWVLERPCAECGFDPQAYTLADLPQLMHDTAMVWSQVLLRPDVRERPAPAVWSPLEYACHVRDVHRLFAERVELMLDEDEPRFANWDQDATATASSYAEQDPAEVDADLVEAAGHVAGLYATVTPEAAQRRGSRSNGSEFSVTTLGIYHLHDIVHHVHDVRA
ncbi:DinB family protein [Nocardioides sp.]|uniref:DinB family protein n=1 Tax=Nocardioides sp. TaxID=35761 RepID=UPI002BBD9525|nr:DinB family protein [Nocardioides sp.]HXH78809.1 DinB family protein [Nocardioides sp.]